MSDEHPRLVDRHFTEGKGHLLALRKESLLTKKTIKSVPLLPLLKNNKP